MFTYKILFKNCITSDYFKSVKYFRLIIVVNRSICWLFGPKRIRILSEKVKFANSWNIHKSYFHVTIDKLLNWCEHIDHLWAKLSSITFSFRVLVPELDKEMIFQIYYTNDDRCLKYAVGFGGSSDEIVKVFFREE